MAAKHIENVAFDLEGSDDLAIASQHRQLVFAARQNPLADKPVIGCASSRLADGSSQNDDS